MKYIFVILTGMWLCWNSAATAQDKLTTKSRQAAKLYGQAGDRYAQMNYSDAIKLLQQAVEKDEQFIEAYLLLGDIYNKQRAYHKEIEALQKAVAIDSTFFPMTHFNIGVAACNAGLYSDAINWLERYKANSPSVQMVEKAESWLVKARFGQESVKYAYKLNLIPAGDGINSEFDEYWPSLTADEQTMVFTTLLPRNIALYRERGELPKSSLYFQEDFFVSERDSEGVWQNRFPLEGQINTEANEGAQSLSADGNLMFFTACGRDDSKGSCDIYFSYKTGNGWSIPQNIGAPVNSPYWESQPCFAADGQTLLFVSNRTGGQGGMDVWQATIQGYRDDGTPYFGNLTNLGSNINTSGNENSPFLHHDNETLYFSSDGRPGMGGEDIFMSHKRTDGEWEQPVNLGYPINTEGEEIGLTINARGNRAYFSADNREGKRSGKDIYYFNLPVHLQPKPALYVKGRVFDSETGNSLPADFQLQELSTGRLVVTSRGNRFSGEFLVSLPVGGQYAFRAEHPGYMFYSGHFDIDQSHPLDKPYNLDIALNPIKTGVTITLENIFYETNSYELLEPSKVELNVLVKFLEDNATVKLLIGGHTDNVGAAAYNQKLSENRAESVHKYLVSQGIAPERLQFKGFGMNSPVQPNDTDEGRAKNRRTEITVL